MTWMNRFEVEDAAGRWFDQETQPNLHRGAQLLLKLMEWTDNNSDGWPYWTQPQRAADKLMNKLQEFRRNQYNAFGRDTDLTDAELKATLTPIKSFLTRRGVDHAVLLGDKPAPKFGTGEESRDVLVTELVPGVYIDGWYVGGSNTLIVEKLLGDNGQGRQVGVVALDKGTGEYIQANLNTDRMITCWGKVGQ